MKVSTVMTGMPASLALRRGWISWVVVGRGDQDEIGLLGDHRIQNRNLGPG
jgi:hypothetical protein